MFVDVGLLFLYFFCMCIYVCIFTYLYNDVSCKEAFILNKHYYYIKFISENQAVTTLKRFVISTDYFYSEYLSVRFMSKLDFPFFS